MKIVESLITLIELYDEKDEKYYELENALTRFNEKIKNGEITPRLLFLKLLQLSFSSYF